MTVILAGTALSGVMFSEFLFWLGMDRVLLRYPVSLCLAYVCFFLFIRLWLTYIAAVSGSRSSSSNADDGFDYGVDAVEVGADVTTDAAIDIADAADIVAPIIYTIPLQLLSYHVAVLKGTDVDQPRNLAKSVTVE